MMENLLNYIKRKIIISLMLRYIYRQYKKTITGLNAAFVNVGYEKDAFLHYHDLGPRVKTLLKYTRLIKEGKIKNFS